MEIKSLANTGFDSIFEAFSEAFSEYEIQISKTELHAMFNRRGFRADLSFAAFEGDRIVSFTCNGIGKFAGLPTAYDTGTGTLKDYRGKGLATRIFEYSIPYLKRKGIAHYLLEVLQHNPKAASVYRNIGFEVSREFDYFLQDNDNIRNEMKTPGMSYRIQSIKVGEFDQTLCGFWDFHPSWQNSFESVQRVPETFVSFGVFTGNKLVGYCVFEPVSGDITQMAIDKRYRRKGFASLLLGKMLEWNKCSSVKLINADTSADAAVKGFLEAKNIPLKGKQFEMIKELK